MSVGLSMVPFSSLPLPGSTVSLTHNSVRLPGLGFSSQCSLSPGPVYGHLCTKAGGVVLIPQCSIVELDIGDIGKGSSRGSYPSCMATISLI